MAGPRRQHRCSPLSAPFRHGEPKPTTPNNPVQIAQWKKRALPESFEPRGRRDEQQRRRRIRRQPFKVGRRLVSGEPGLELRLDQPDGHCQTN